MFRKKPEDETPDFESKYDLEPDFIPIDLDLVKLEKYLDQLYQNLLVQHSVERGGMSGPTEDDINLGNLLRDKVYGERLTEICIKKYPDIASTGYWSGVACISLNHANIVLSDPRMAKKIIDGHYLANIGRSCSQMANYILDNYKDELSHIEIKEIELLRDIRNQHDHDRFFVEKYQRRTDEAAKILGKKNEPKENLVKPDKPVDTSIIDKAKKEDKELTQILTDTIRAHKNDMDDARYEINKLFMDRTYGARLTAIAVKRYPYLFDDQGWATVASISLDHAKVVLNCAKVAADIFKNRFISNVAVTNQLGNYILDNFKDKLSKYEVFGIERAIKGRTPAIDKTISDNLDKLRTNMLVEYENPDKTTKIITVDEQVKLDREYADNLQKELNQEEPKPTRRLSR